jgi:hypothetical protein
LVEPAVIKHSTVPPLHYSSIAPPPYQVRAVEKRQ